MARSSTSSAPREPNDPSLYSTQLSGCTIRARVAFVLAIAEVVRNAITAREEVAERIRSALDLAWRWEQFGGVSGRALYDMLENENEDGLMVEEWAAPEAQKPAWVAMTSAISYTSWHAFVTAGDKRLPEPIDEVSEEVIDQTVAYARRAPGFDPRCVDRLAQYCVDHHRTADSSVLGEPIAREAMLQVTNGTC
jgi:hypothetical protein